MLATVAWVQYRRDNNVTRLELDPSGTVLLRRFLSPDFRGLRRLPPGKVLARRPPGQSALPADPGS